MTISLSLALVPARAESVDPELGGLFERALQNAEEFRKQMKTAEYEATMRVQEWDGRGRLRGTAKARAIMRPGAARPMTFLSREMQGKVRLPSDKPEGKKEAEEDISLQEFSREHRMAERFDFKDTGTEQISGQRARRITFEPNGSQPKKNTADRFLDAICGVAWVSEGDAKLVKLEMKLLKPFQLLWIFAVLKELSVEYELIAPGDILGHAKLRVLFALSTPVYSIRQLHEVDLDKFRRRDAVAVQRPVVRPITSTSMIMSTSSLCEDLSSTSGGRFGAIRSETRL